jgi:metal-dependent amidase/aminoacylase/carboxypeptidase family protein
MEEKFKNIIHGACMITGATSDIKPMGNPYKSRKANKVLNKEYFEITKELGMNPVVPKRLARGSSDFGDFSHAIPGIHAYFGISTEEISAHSIKFADAANSDYAMEQMLKAACAMAYIGYNYISNKTFRDNVADAFNMI